MLRMRSSLAVCNSFLSLPRLSFYSFPFFFIFGNFLLFLSSFLWTSFLCGDSPQYFKIFYIFNKNSNYYKWYFETYLFFVFPQNLDILEVSSFNYHPTSSFLPPLLSFDFVPIVNIQDFDSSVVFLLH